MSNNQRSVAEIQQSYSQVCARLGHCEYQIGIFKRDAEALRKELEELNLEAAASAAAASKQAEAQKEASAPENADSVA
jgi:hypothetical protein